MEAMGVELTSVKMWRIHWRTNWHNCCGGGAIFHDTKVAFVIKAKLKYRHARYNVVVTYDNPGKLNPGPGTLSFVDDNGSTRNFRFKGCRGFYSTLEKVVKGANPWNL